MKKPLLPFVPTPDERVGIMLKFAQVKPGQKSIDLGAGDGKIVIAMAKAGALATGIEIQEKYVRRAKWNIAQSGLQEKASVFPGDFWHVDLKPYEIVTIYGMAAIIERVSEKLTRELGPGAIVISNGFALPGWRVERSEDHLYLHIKR
jgi:ribosomal protein L11 methylase PrmA